MGTSLISQEKLIREPGRAYSIVHHVAAAVGRVAVREPLNGTREIGGPAQFRPDDLVRTALTAQNDPREVLADEHARYFDTLLDDRTLIPEPDAQRGHLTFAEWLTRQWSGPGCHSPSCPARAVRSYP